MFNPERLLGGLLRESSGSSRGWGTKSAVGLGLLGVAMEAAEHFMNKSQNSPANGAPPPPPGSPATVPPPPPTGGRASAPPAPPPGQASATTPSAPAPPTPPTAAPADPEPQAREAVLLIRAMIAAANADGRIDADERQSILEKLEKLQLSTEERAFIEAELLAPASLATIAGQVKTAQTASQVYAVSLMAITVDTDAERAYLQTLAQELGLAPGVVAKIHAKLGTTA